MSQDLEYIKQLQQNSVDSQKTFDRGLLTLSAGEIVLSVTAVTDMDIVACKAALLVAWLLLFMSLTSQLSSHLFSVKAHDAAVDGEIDKSNRYSRSVEYLNITSLVSFFIGSGFFLWFIINNV